MSERTSVLSGLTLESVSLKSIEGMHPLVSAHLNRADVIPSNTMDLSEWTEQSVELLQAAAPGFEFGLQRGQRRLGAGLGLRSGGAKPQHQGKRQRRRHGQSPEARVNRAPPGSLALHHPHLHPN